MKRLSILLLALSLFSCGHSRHSVNLEARKLNDSAIMMRQKLSGVQLESRIGKDSFAKIQLALLNKATDIDGNYFTAYWNKFNLQCEIKQYKGALVSGKEMIRLAPKDAMAKFRVGKIYDVTGDTASAMACYEFFLSSCNKALHKIPVGDRSRKFIELNKGLVLVLLGRQKEGHDILAELYNNETDSLEKQLWRQYMGLTRTDIMNDKQVSATSVTNP